MARVINTHISYHFAYVFVGVCFSKSIVSSTENLSVHHHFVIRFGNKIHQSVFVSFFVFGESMSDFQFEKLIFN